MKAKDEKFDYGRQENLNFDGDVRDENERLREELRTTREAAEWLESDHIKLKDQLAKRRARQGDGGLMQFIKSDAGAVVVIGLLIALIVGVAMASAKNEPVSAKTKPEEKREVVEAPAPRRDLRAETPRPEPPVVVVVPQPQSPPVVESAPKYLCDPPTYYIKQGSNWRRLFPPFRRGRDKVYVVPGRCGWVR
jgi:hypothetical protein